jgi:hypothetical protein
MGPAKPALPGTVLMFERIAPDIEVYKKKGKAVHKWQPRTTITLRG